MEVNEARQALGRPEMARLKQLGRGLKVGRVLGNRVLVKPIKPFTEIDRLEKEGLLVAPQKAKEDNTPKSTIGVVVLIGEGVPCKRCHLMGYQHNHDFTKSPMQLRCGWDDVVFEAQLSEGDGVMFSKYAGADFLIEEESFRIVNVDDILCTFVDPEGDIKEE